ncbi:MAG: radical SAM protein [Candidatus Omnitrophica bacterium]|nr:radical SAM protein [Candidatus Omnitrophota bacterium]
MVLNPELAQEYNDIERKLSFFVSRKLSYPLIPPEHVYFSITSACNLRCRMCDIPQGFAEDAEVLSSLKIKDIILQIKNMGINHLILSGGEPFLHKDILDIVGFALSRGIQWLSIITNGTLLNDEIIQGLIERKLNHMTVSIDGLGPRNDEIRGPGTFEKAAHSIDRINYYKNKKHAQFPLLGINFTIMDTNIDDIIPMIDFARQKKCHMIVFQPVLFSNTKMYEMKSNPLWPTDKQVRKLERILKKVVSLKEELQDIYIATDRAILESIPAYFRGEKIDRNFKCYEGIKRIVIDCNGQLWSCRGRYGDLKEESLQNNWVSENATAMRELVRHCRRHCLQDCVYFPEDILQEIKIFLKKLDALPQTREVESIRDKLYSKIEEYSALLAKKGKPYFKFYRHQLRLLKKPGEPQKNPCRICIR